MERWRGVRLAVTNFFLRSAHHVLINLHANQCYSLSRSQGSTSKSNLWGPGLTMRRGPQAGLSPCPEHWSSPRPRSSSQCPAQLRRWISAQDALMDGSPDPTWPSYLREPGAQHPAALRVLRPPKWGPDSSDLDPWRRPPRLDCEVGMGRGSPPPPGLDQGQWMAIAMAL